MLSLCDDTEFNCDDGSCVHVGNLIFCYIMFFLPLL